MGWCAWPAFDAFCGTFHYFPTDKYRDLHLRDRRTVKYVTDHIHRLPSHPRGTGPSSLAIIRGHQGPLQHPPDLRPCVGGVQGWTRGDGDLVQDGDTQCQLGTFGMSEIQHHDPSSHRGKLRSSCRTSMSPLSPSRMLSFHAMVEKDIEITQRL